ncbi:MAG: SH3 domain-containing protein, partial [Ruminococcus sp.]|nr:SH3 domain-containing protein [Ruminococcus sp.]
YDINKDGFYELILHVGESEGDSQMLIYTINEDDIESPFVEVGELDGSHTSIVENDGKLYTSFTSNGYQVVEEIKIFNQHNEWVISNNTVFEQENLSEYKNYGIPLKEHDISDTTAVEEICLEELIYSEHVTKENTLLKGIVITETDPLNVRQSPSLNAKIIGTVAKGSTIEIYSKENGWCEIRYNGQIGYVSKDYIECK